MSTVLVKFEAVRRALAEATAIDELKEIRDQAVALEAYTKQRGYTLEMGNDIAEIRLRAERRIGELLEAGDKHPPGPVPYDNHRDLPPKLADLGISYQQSQHWQQEASVPEGEFEQFIAKTKAAGKELTSIGLRNLFKELKHQETEAARSKLAAQGALIPPNDRWHIEVGDIKTYNPGRQFDFIITDPPYPKEYLPLYDILARRAFEWLLPEGLLIVMCGQSYLDQIYNTLSSHLVYYWTSCYLTPGQPTPLIQKQVNCCWKPILIYSPTGQYSGKTFGDVYISPKPEKDSHDWEQSVEGMLSLISQICLPGQSIFDPFLGSGTTGIAALRHGCIFYGIDIDERAVNISKTRLVDDTTEI